MLPVKVFNGAGEGSYFDLLCGYKFAANKPGMDVINMSFGWCSENGSYTLLEQFIEETEEQGEIVIVTSAGNKMSNNDQLTHYPSSFANQNLLSITAVNDKLDALADFANYGQISVDFAAVGDQISFEFSDGSVQVVSGTSFSAANVSALVAYLLSEGDAPDNIESVLVSKGTLLNSLDDIKYSSYLLK